MAYPNLKQSIWLLVLWTLIAVGLAILIAIMGTIIDEPLLEYDYSSGLLMLVNFILVLCYVSRRADRTWKDLLPLAIRNIDYNWRMWLSVGLSIFGLGIVLTELHNAVICVLPMPEMVQDIFHKLVGKKTSYLSALFVAVVIAPLAEEIIFRGIILKGLLAHYTQNRAIVWSALLFGLIHLNPWQFPTAFVVGLVFAYWVIQTGSLWPAILGHALNNLIAVTSLHFDVPGFPVSEDLNVVVHNPWWLNVCGPILAVLGLWWFYQLAKREEIDQPEAKVEPEVAPVCNNRDGYVPIHTME